MTKRIDKVNKLLFREVSLILQTELEDFRVRVVTITRVEVTRDLRQANIYFTAAGSSEEVQEAERALARHTKFIRGRLASRVFMKYMPRISFRRDKFREYEDGINTIFQKLKKERNLQKWPQEEGP